MIPILPYPGSEAEAFLGRLAARGQIDEERVLAVVRQIIARVCEEGDAAVLELTNRFDCPDSPLRGLRVSDEAIERAYAHVTDAFLDALRTASENIRRFHEHQKEDSWFVAEGDGVLLGQLVVPLERVGMHIPAASAPLMSSLMMAAIPARVAGVREVIATIPPAPNGRIHPAMLVTAKECGVDEVYACGGAQAIAAMAYGTESIRRVDKIVGPGNPYSQLAKREVFGVVDVDKIAGPSEVLVLADETATPEFIAADLISQAEHSSDCSAILVTTSRSLAEAVDAALEAQTAALPRAEVIREAFAAFGVAFCVEDLDVAVALANEIAPEHAEVHTRDAFDLAVRLRNVGGIFIGEYAPEALGDYAAGPNHILPTGGTARFASSMSVRDFLKRSNLLGYSASALRALRVTVVTFAEAEGLDGHAAAMTIRCGEDPR